MLEALERAHVEVFAAFRHSKTWLALTRSGEVKP
jgi:hypothetical protein